MSKFVPACLTVALLTITTGLTHADQWERSFQVGPEPTVHIHTDDGHIRVVPGTSDQVEVKITTEGWDIGDEVRVDASQEGDHVEVKAFVPNFQWSYRNRHRKLFIEVHVPAETDLDLHSGDGSLAIHGIRGRLRADTGDGDIDADHVAGDLELITGDGEITLEVAEGSVFCKSSDGDIHVRGRFDALRIESGDGDVRAEVEHGSVLTEDWSISTGDGSMVLVLPGDLAADLDVQAGDGSIDMDFPMTVEGHFQRHHLRGSLNGGGAMLRVRSGDGGIRIERS